MTYTLLLLVRFAIFKLLELTPFVFIFHSCYTIPVPNLEGELMSKITQEGLDYIRKIGVPFLVMELNSLRIPNVSGSTGTPLGTVSYGLSEIVLSGVSVPKSNLTIAQKKGLTVTASDAKLKIHAKWKYRQNGWPHINDNGSCDLSVKQLHLEVTVTVDTRIESHPKVETISCKLSIGNLKLRFHGGASWLYNLFSGPIAADIKGTLEKEVCKAMSKEVDVEGDRLLNKLPSVLKAIQDRMKLVQRDEIEDDDF